MERNQKDIKTFVRLNSCGHFLILAAVAPLFLSLDRDRFSPLDFGTYLLMCLLVTIALYGVRASLVKFLSRRMAIALESFVLFTFIADIVLVLRLGVHLDSPSVLGAFAMSDTNFGIDISWPFRLLAIFCLVGAVFIERFLFEKVHLLPEFQLNWIFKPWRLATYAAMSAGILASLEFQADFATVPSQAVPIYQSAIRLIHGFPQFKLKMEKGAGLQGLEMKKKPNILMVLAESFRWDLVSPELTPNLYKLSQDPKCIFPSKSYAGGHLTSMGAFAYLYGSDAFLARPFFKNRRSSPALSILRENGYKIFASDASGLPSYNPKVVQLEQFDGYDQHSAKHSAANDVSASLSLLKRISGEPEGKPVFGFLFLYATHIPYFSPFNWPEPKVPRIDKGSYTSSFADYQKSATFVDHQVGEVLEAMASRKNESGLIFSFAGDHGEEFGEFGGQGHAAVGFVDVRTRVPNIVCFPNGTSMPAKKIELSTNADIMPSIFAWSQIPKQKLDSLFTGKSFWSETPRGIAIISGAYFPTDGRDFAITDGNLKLRMYFEGSGPSTSRIRISVDDQDRRLASQNDAQFQSLINSADKEFHKYLVVEGEVASYAKTTETSPSQH